MVLTDFADSLQHTDQSIGQIITALKQQGLFDSTLVVLTAKHGQNPRVGPGIFVGDVLTPALTAANIQVAQATEDDVAQIWLKDQSQTAQAAAALVKLAQTTPADGIDTIYSGASLVQAGFGNPATDGRAPDIVVKMRPGFVLSTSKKKQAEHGGLAPDDTNVGLILNSGTLAASLRGTTQTAPVFTTQVATTVLQALGLDPNALQGVQAEKTQVLPGLNFFA